MFDFRVVHHAFAGLLEIALAAQLLHELCAFGQWQDAHHVVGEAAAVVVELRLAHVERDDFWGFRCLDEAGFAGEREPFASVEFFGVAGTADEQGE